MHFGMPAPRAALITIVCTFVVRVLAITFNWSTKPLHRLETPGDEQKR
jgi:uncharacterized membrane protein YeiH